MKKFLVSIFPGALFAACAPLIFYLLIPDNKNLNAYSEILGPALVSLALFGIFYGLAYLLIRSFQPAGLIAAILLIGTLYLWQISLVIVAAMLFSALWLRLRRRKIDFFSVNILLGGFGMVLIGYYGFQLASFLVRLPATAGRSLVQPVAAAGPDRTAPGGRPDVYYIILDGYGRADMLDSVYGYNNSPFIGALQDLGFTVPAESRSNYPFTVPSLDSSLNMQYLDQMASVVGDSPVWWLTGDTIRNSQVRQFLEKAGYRTVFIASGFDYTDIRDGNEYVKPYPVMLTNFEGEFFSFTNLSILGDMGGLISYPSYSTYRQTIRNNFAALPQIARESGPKFVFAHVTAPHPPFVFDEAGNPVNPNYPFTLADKMRTIMDVPTYERSYASEVRYVNDQVITTVRAILANSATPPIIVIQGDHGPGVFLGGTAADTCLYERFSILNAYYLPGEQSNPVPQTITPVNTFRFIFNEYFSTDFPILPDKSYFVNYSHFYAYQDITGQIKPACAGENR